MNVVERNVGHTQTEAGRQSQRHSEREMEDAGKDCGDRVPPRTFQEPATGDFQSPLHFHNIWHEWRAPFHCSTPEVDDIVRIGFDLKFRESPCLLQILLLRIY